MYCRDISGKFSIKDAHTCPDAAVAFLLLPYFVPVDMSPPI